MSVALFQNSLIRGAGRVFIVVLTAYSIAYGLVRALPEFGTGVLGLTAADPQVTERFRIESEIPASLTDAIKRVVRANFGQTVNRRPVTSEIAQAAAKSLPTTLAAAGFVAVAILLGGFLGLYDNAVPLAVTRLFAFLPAYLPAYVGAGLFPLLGIAAADDRFLGFLVVAALTALIPAAVVSATVQASVSAARAAPYYLTLEAHGYSKLEALRLIAPTTLKQLLPMIASVVSTLIMVQVFVEALLAYPGIGTSLLQALRRTDINLILGYVLLLTTAHEAVGAVTAAIMRRRFGAGL